VELAFLANKTIGVSSLHFQTASSPLQSIQPMKIKDSPLKPFAEIIKIENPP
jgi:hypothetical protein